MNLPSSKPSQSESQVQSPLNIFPFSKGDCYNCNVKDRWLLHNAVVGGASRRICTSCVLRLNPSTFCPYCFEFFENPLSTTSSSSSHRFISCVKCSSLSHIQCLSSSSSPPSPSSYHCPPCSQPNFTFFPVPESPVDEKLAKVFLCACKIASSVMKKQFTLFNTRSERAVKEAAIARKKTKEAIEQCFALQRLHGSLDVSNNNKNAVKKEDLSGVYGHGHPQSQNGPLNNKIGTSGNNPVVVNNIGANVIDGRIGNTNNNGGRFGPPFKTSAF
ncbi:hypothetical protein TSUD_35270 [Trifolium subterraneum]|uniref:Uncharacterized protein n=1 Tax=Trifolium subterraneum TaxID=3900 RepID=A0A2Z6LR03_TRISU|nr:hypothetical protein TSUD_35270 [Trifolium subterraneum]